MTWHESGWRHDDMTFTFCDRRTLVYDPPWHCKHTNSCLKNNKIIIKSNKHTRKCDLDIHLQFCIVLVRGDCCFSEFVGILWVALDSNDVFFCAHPILGSQHLTNKTFSQLAFSHFSHFTFHILTAAASGCLPMHQLTLFKEPTLSGAAVMEVSLTWWRGIINQVHDGYDGHGHGHDDGTWNVRDGFFSGGDGPAEGGGGDKDLFRPESFLSDLHSFVILTSSSASIETVLSSESVSPAALSFFAEPPSSLAKLLVILLACSLGMMLPVMMVRKTLRKSDLLTLVAWLHAALNFFQNSSIVADT